MNQSYFSDLPPATWTSSLVAWIALNVKPFDALYDLSGRRVNSNTPAHGIYVKKGMKIAK